MLWSEYGGGMAKTTKMTFTLDEATVRALRRAASDLGKPQSWVVREAVMEYGTRSDKMSPEERIQALTTYREIMQTLPKRPRHEVEAELEEVRRARREDRRNR
jgi:hypothetical protein